MAGMSNADPLNSVTVDTQLPPIPKDMHGSDSSVPFTPQWLLPKLGDNKLGLEADEKRTDPLKALGNIQDLSISEKKQDVFRPSFYDAENVRRDCWTDEEREANSAIRRDLQEGEGEELSDSRKLERWSNSSSRYSSESRHFPSDRWTGSGSREGPYEPRRESKWNTRWGPDDKESENWREKCPAKDGESSYNKGAHCQTIISKDIKNQAKNTDKDGEHYTRSWRSSSSVNRRGETSPYLPTTNKSASTFSYGRGKGDAGTFVSSFDRSRVGASNVGGGGPTRQFHSGTAAGKTNGSQRDPPGLRYSRMRLFDIYRTTDLKGYRKAFEGFQEFPSLIQADHLVPLALTAPITEELVIMEAIENGEILSSGVPQALKDGSSGNSSVDSGLLILTKSGIGEDVAPVLTGSRDERTSHGKKDHIFVEGAVYNMPSRGNLGHYEQAALTSEAFKLEVTPNSTHDLGKVEANKLENTIPSMSQSVGARSLSSNDPRDLAKLESGSSDMGCLNRLEGMGIGPSSRCADSSSYVTSNLQWQNPKNIRADTRMESQLRRQPSNMTEQGQGDFFIPREKLSDRKPQQYLSPEHLSLFYKDPQGHIQGPFSGSNLIEWFDAGFFGLVLPVRLANAPADAPFSMLGDVIPQLRTRVRPPPGFGSSRPNDFAEAPNRGKIGNVIGVPLGISDLELTKNGQILGDESKVEAENRFLESLMAGRINSSMTEGYLSEGMQGYNGLTGGRTSFEIGNMNDMKYMSQKISLEQQRLLTSFQTASDSPSVISKADSLREVPVPQIGEIPHQHLDLLSILQSATITTPPPPINSPLPLWPNFPEVQAMKNTHGGIDITKDSLGLNPNQQSSQTRFGALPNRLQTQFQPSLSNQTPFFGLPSGIIPPEKSVAPEFGQDAQMVNLMQQYMLAQNVRSQVPTPTHLNHMDLLFLMQRQKMEQQQQQDQLHSHTFSGNHLHNRYDEQSFWPPSAEASNVNAAMECPVPQKHEAARTNSLNILDFNDSHVLGVSSLSLHGAQDANIAGNTEHSELDLPNQVTDLVSLSNEMDASPMLDLAIQTSTSEQMVSTTNNPVVSQVASSALEDLVSSEKDDVSVDFLSSVSGMIHHVKDALPAISGQVHGETPRPKVMHDAELCVVNKTLEKKSRKHKNLQLLKVAPSEKSKTNSEAGVEKDMPLKSEGPLMESSEFALDKKTEVEGMNIKEVSSNNLTWNPAPGQKVKSLLEIQMEEQSRTLTNPSSSSMPKNKQANVSFTSDQKSAVDSVQYDSLENFVSENSEKLEFPWTLRNRSQLHDVLAEEVLPKVSEISKVEKITYSPPLPSENERDVDLDFTVAKDTRKARKRAAKNKDITTKSSLPSNSAGLPVSVSTVEKSKPAQPLQDKELLPSPPSAPSLGDFVFWKGDQASKVTTPVWSTDSVKVQKPASLKDIFREQDKNTKSGRPQIPLQSTSKVQPSKGGGGSSMGKVSASRPSEDQIASPIQTRTLVSGHQKTGMEDDLFWGPLDRTKKEIRLDFPSVSKANSEKLKGRNSVKVAYGEASSKKASNAKLAEHCATTSSPSPSPSPSVKQPLSKGKKDSESKNSDATDFRNWCGEEWSRLTGTDDMSFLEYCLKQTTTEAEALLREKVSLLNHGKEFVDKFVKYKKFLSSEAIEIAFQAPRGSGVSSNLDAEAADGVDCSSKGKKKGKKGKKVSPALLGFNVVSNRIMMGEIQTIED